MEKQVWILNCVFDFEKIEVENYKILVERLLLSTKKFTQNGVIFISKEDISLANELDRQSNPAGGNTLAILSQLIEAINAGFNGNKKLEDFGLLTKSNEKYISFYIK